MTKQNDQKANAKENLPLQKLLEGDYLRIMRMHEDFHQLSEVPHRHDHYELLYITEGTGTHFINFKEFEVKPGRVYFLHPGQVHLIDKFKRNGWLIMFGEELFKQFLDLHKYENETGLLDLYTEQPFIDLDARLTHLFDHTIAQLQQELAVPKVHPGILFHYAALVMLKANRAHQTQHPKKVTDGVSRFDFYRLKQLVEANFTRQHLASFYADAMKVDIKKLNRICRESTGFTVAQLINNRLLTESKVQLQTTSASVKEISYQLGFNDPAFFGRFFKQQTRLTPVDFRNKQLI